MIQPTDIETGRTEYANVRTVKEHLTALTHLDVHAPWVPLAESWSPRQREETPASHFSFSFDSTSRGTPTLADMLKTAPARPSVVDPSEVEEPPEPFTDRAGREASVRLELLARKTAERLTVEEDARLRVATERLRKLLPRVSATDFEKLATTTESVNAIGERTEELRRKLGL